MEFLIQQTLVYTAPLLIVALAGIFSERSGVINIALDGIMIMGSFVGVLVCTAFTNLNVDIAMGQGIFLIGMLVSAIAGAAFSWLLSFSAVKLKADQTIAGTALNLIAPAFVLFVVNLFFNGNMSAPTTEWFIIHQDADLGVLGNALFDKMYISTYVILILFIVLSIWLYKTRFGLRLRSCGEHPQAADSVGINVYAMRYWGTTISGALAGLGGFVYISTISGGAVDGTVHGMGFLALAIMIFGNWKPTGVFFGALLFGLLKCVASAYTSLDINGDGIYWLNTLGISRYFYQILPYICTLLVLAFTSKSSRAPKAEGIPYDKGQR